MNKLAITGGKKIFPKNLKGTPLTDDLEIKYVNECLNNNTYSRFVGSPVGGYRDQLKMSSSEASKISDEWSVLGGKFVRLFESEFAKNYDVKYAVSMNSATSGITAAILAAGIRPGDEVITTPISFTATATAIHLSGAKVVFADIDEKTYCMDPKSLKSKITKKTKAVVPVHFDGNAGNIFEIDKICKSNNLILIEDSAQALLCKKNNKFLGSIGLAGIYSFQESKNIMTGEGGMVITNDDEMAYRMRLIRNHGESMVYRNLDNDDRIKTALGYNFRLAELLAAVGYAQTKKIKKINLIRKKNYEILKKGLKSFNFIEFQKITNDPDEFYPYHIGLTFDEKTFGFNRDVFVDAVIAEGLPLTKGIPRTLDTNLIFKNNKKLPNAQKMNNETYIGIVTVGFPNGKKEMNKIIETFDKVNRNKNELKSISSKKNKYKVYR